jgi:hypothetical protein
MRKFVFTLVALVAWSSVNAQKRNYGRKPSYDSKDEVSSFGIGLGLDYGGIGARYTYFVNPYIGVFGSGGYAIAGLGYNAGVVLRLLNKTRITPTLSAMYGYNAAIKVDNLPSPPYDMSKLYYGPSVGLGLIRKSKSGLGYWHSEIILPFRSSEYDRDHAYVKSIPNLILKSDPGAVLFSFGYNVTIKK